MSRVWLVVPLVVVGCVERAQVPDVVLPPAASERIAAVSERDPLFAWRRLRMLAGDIGHRMSGSPALDRAIEWSADAMRADGLQSVHLEPVSVPHWVRGEEHARIAAPIDRPLALLALGGSVGTGGTIRARVVAFESLDALRASTTPLDGTIVVVNHVMAAYDDATDDPGYRRGVQARLHAASEAARRGARAVLVRSVTHGGRNVPHTGALTYAADVPRIPAAALAVDDAELVSRLARQGPVEIELSLGAHRLPDAQSANVIGELVGRALPDEIVLLGAHIDTWDVGEGAADDGAGCVAVMEAARLLHVAALHPRRTIRVVLFTGEEYGLAGARAYAKRHGDDRHVAAFETDYGMGAPDAIGVGSEERVRVMAPLLPLFGRFGIRRFLPRAFGADVAPIVARGAAGYDLEPDGRHYFDVHHSAADTLDRVDPEHLRRNAAAIALLAWVLADG